MSIGRLGDGGEWLLLHNPNPFPLPLHSPHPPTADRQEVRLLASHEWLIRPLLVSMMMYEMQLVL